MFHLEYNVAHGQPHENCNVTADFKTYIPTQPQTVPAATDLATGKAMASTTTIRSGSNALDKLAVELLTLISLYACTDGGPTGCALSLVSKRMRAASHPARFFSVSLTMESPTQLKQFLACYQAECARAADALPRVQHLCLSLFGREEDGAPMTNGTPPSSQLQATHVQHPPTSRAEFLARMQRQAQQWRSAQDRLDEGYNYVVPALFRAVAPDLRTLTLIQARWRVNGTVQCCFPHLRELTLVGGDSSFLPFGFTQDGRPQYPSLRRLHHNLAFVGTGLNFLEWAAHAPNLTHLRVSRLDSKPRVIVDTLERAIGACTLRSRAELETELSKHDVDADPVRRPSCRRPSDGGVLPASKARHDPAERRACTVALERGCVRRVHGVSGEVEEACEGPRGRPPPCRAVDNLPGSRPTPGVYQASEEAVDGTSRWRGAWMLGGRCGGSTITVPLTVKKSDCRPRLQ